MNEADMILPYDPVESLKVIIICAIYQKCYCDDNKSFVDGMQFISLEHANQIDINVIDARSKHTQREGDRHTDRRAQA